MSLRARQAGPTPFDDGHRLVLNVADAPPPRGKVLAQIPLNLNDVQLARDDAWWRGVRAGRLEPDLDAYTVRLVPGPATGPLRNGYTIQFAGGRQEYEQHFGVTTLEHLARRKFLEVVDAELAIADDGYKFYLTVEPAGFDGSPTPSPLHATMRREPLVFESASLAEATAASQPLTGASPPPDDPESPPMPVFVAEEAWEEGRQQAYLGGEAESAALFSGRLFRDSQSPEVFVLWEACLEARDTVQDKYSVEFTGATWAHARRLLDQRRRRLDRPHEIIVASVHRHPWLPSQDEDGNRVCDQCSARERCTRTTAMPSADDLEFHCAVFAGQPWATLAIWGYTARGEEDFRLFGLRSAGFHHRSLRLIKKGVLGP